MIQRWCWDDGGMNHDDFDGEWVRYDDHAALLRERDARIAELERALVEFCGAGIRAAQLVTERALAADPAPQAANPCATCGGSGKLAIVDVSSTTEPFVRGEANCPTCKPREVE